MLAQELFKSETSTANVVKISKQKNALYEQLFREISLKTTDGKRYKLSDIKAKTIILNFWASWCTPCLKEFPSLVSLIEKFDEEKLVVIGINNDDEKPLKKIDKTREEYKLNFPSISDADGTVTSKFLISDIPVSIIFHDGKVYEVSKGEKDFLDPELLKLINN